MQLLTIIDITENNPDFEVDNMKYDVNRVLKSIIDNLAINNITLLMPSNTNALKVFLDIIAPTA